MLPRPHFEQFWIHCGRPLGPVWAHVGCHFFDVFLNWLFDGLGFNLGSQNTSKMRPKRKLKPKADIHRFCFYLQHLSHIQGCLKSSFLVAFLEPSFGVAFGAHFDDFGSLLGPLWRPCWSLFGDPFWELWKSHANHMEITRKSHGNHWEKCATQVRSDQKVI